MKKKGLELAVTMVIVIVMSIAVLTILLMFANSQTGFFSKWVINQNGKNNVDAIVTGCNNLVATESSYSYCCEEKEIVIDKDTRFLKTCDVFREDAEGGRILEMDCSGVCSS